MARRRTVSKAEHLAYEVLKDHTTGERFQFQAERASLYSIFKTPDLYRAGKLIYSSNLSRDEYVEFFKLMPKYKPILEEMAKEATKVRKAIERYDELKLAFVKEVKEQVFENQNINFESAYLIRTDAQEIIYQDLKANPDKIPLLKVRKTEIETQLAGMPQNRASAPLRKTVKEELDRIIDQLKLFNEA